MKPNQVRGNTLTYVRRFNFAEEFMKRFHTVNFTSYQFLSLFY